MFYRPKHPAQSNVESISSTTMIWRVQNAAKWNLISRQQISACDTGSTRNIYLKNK
jgi:hypothetical protein